MESQPQNPEFRNNPEIFHPWEKPILMHTLTYPAGLEVKNFGSGIYVHPKICEYGQRRLG